MMINARDEMLFVNNNKNKNQMEPGKWKIEIGSKMQMGIVAGILEKALP